MSQRLNELASSIRISIQQDTEHSNLMKWERAGMYSEARNHFRSDRLFGQWCGNLRQSFRAEWVAESQPTINRLIRAHEVFTQEQFCSLGMARVKELIAKKDWELYPEQMEHLVSVADGMTSREVVEAVKAVRAGHQFVVPEPVVDEVALLRKQVEDIQVENAILRNQYRYSDEEFFHPDTRFREMQIHQLNNSENYVFVMFGVNEPVSEDEVGSIYRRLARRYHPDRQTGSPEMWSVLEDMKNYMINKIRLLERARR